MQADYLDPFFGGKAIWYISVLIWKKNNMIKLIATALREITE
jgi:hypothetical protein